MRHVRFAFGGAFFTASPAACASALFVALLGLLLPLAVHNGYFDITETKLAVFFALAGAYLAALLVLLCARRTRGSLLSAASHRPDAAECAMALFVLAGVISAVPLDAQAALLAPDNRYQGAASLLLYGLCFVGITRLMPCAPRDVRALFLPPLAAFAAVSLLAAVQRLGFDPFRLREALRTLDRGRFLSTIGNIDFYGAYLCLVFPALPYALCRAERWGSRIGLAALLLAGLGGVLSTGGDGASAALVLGALLAPLLLKGRPKEAQRLLLAYSLMLPAAQLFAFLAERSGSGYYFSAVTRFILRPAVSCALAAACLLGCVLLRKGSPGRWYRAYAGALCAAAVCGIIALTLLNTVWREVPLGRLAQFVRFDAHWGTDRGRIWRFCLETYARFPWPQKLFGGGPGCVLAADSLSPLFADALVDTAHCEYLQYLLTSGALGLGAYLALLAVPIGRALKNRAALSDALLLCVLAYAAQSAVGIAQPATTPLFFVLLALLNRITKNAGALCPGETVAVRMEGEAVSRPPSSTM